MSSESSASHASLGRPDFGFALFAEELKLGLARFKRSYQEFLDGHVDDNGPVVGDPVNDIVQRIAVSRAIIGRIDRLLLPEVTARAFGSPGQRGDPEAARNLADSVVTVFSTLLQWGRDARSAVVDSQWQTIYAALANYASQPLRQISAFADDVALKAEAMRAELEMGRTPSTALAINLEVAVGAGEIAALTNVIAKANVVPRVERKRSRLFRR